MLSLWSRGYSCNRWHCHWRRYSELHSRTGGIYTTNTDLETGSVSQGVQQPYEISVITAIEQAETINLVLSAYPNPATDHLTLKIENYDSQNLSYKLFDTNGKLLENKKITGNETIIPIGNLLSGPYFLKVIDTQKEIKTFKIIKH